MHMWQGVDLESAPTDGPVAVGGRLDADALELAHASGVYPIPAPFRVAVDTARVTQHSGRLILSGRTEADRKVTVTARTNGVLTDLRVRRGSRVQQGDVVARLDTSRLMPQLAQAQAQVDAQAAVVAKLKAGSRPEEIAQARATAAARRAGRAAAGRPRRARP